MRRLLGLSERAHAEPRLLGGDSSATQWGRLFLIAVVVTWLLAPVVGFIAALTVLTAIGFIASFLGFSRPSFGVLGVTLVCTLDPLTRHFLSSPLLRWNTFNYWLVLVMLASAAFVLRVADPHSKLLKAFIVILVADLVFSPSPAMGIQHTLGAATLFGLLVYFAQAADDADIWYMVGLVNGTVGALGGLAYLLLKDTVPEMNPNAWALFPETAVFAACLGFRHAAGRARGELTLGLLVAINTMWAFLSGSRGGILIATVGLIFVFLSMKRLTHQIVGVAGAVLIAALTFNAFNSMGQYTLRRIDKLMDEEQSAAGRTSGRSDLALAALHMFTLHPLGVGTGGFAHTWSELGFLPGLSTFKRGTEFQAHSGWFKVLAENGWPGILLLGAYVASFAVYGYVLRRQGMFALGLLTSAGIAVSFVSTEFQSKAVWMLAAAATAQMHPREMARCMTAEIERVVGRPRRIGWRIGQTSAALRMDPP